MRNAVRYAVVRNAAARNAAPRSATVSSAAARSAAVRSAAVRRAAVRSVAVRSAAVRSAVVRSIAPHDRLGGDAATLRQRNLLPARHLGVAWALMLLIAVLAWLLTVEQAGGMGIGAGTMGLALPIFLLLWLAMMTAMMLPSVAPVAITWVRAISRQSAGPVRAARITEFTGGYLLVWTTFGLLAYGVLAAIGRVADDDPGAGRWLGAAAFLVAGLYQIGPLKNVCLRHCRNPVGQLMYYSGFRRRAARDLRVGAHHGLYCVGCCWGLMLVLVPLGVMNIAAMAGLAALIFLEKLWRRGQVLSLAVGVAFLVLAVLAPSQEWLLPALHGGGGGMGPMG